MTGRRAPLGRAEVIALLEQMGRRPSRALGQNFVVDPNTVTRIARLAGVGRGDRVVEIGAGLGSLTLALAATGAAVTAIEIDEHLAPVLRDIVEPEGVRVIVGDALRLDWQSVLDTAGLSAESTAGWVLVANLPYNVATPLVATVLERVPSIGRMLVMVQREVGERLAAGPGSRTYGAISVKVDWFAEASIVGSVPRDVFLPRPNVESVLLKIVRRARPPIDPEIVSYEEVMKLVKAGFASRRKMLRGALSGLIVPEAFGAAGISAESRAEMLDVAAWTRLARCQRSLESSPERS